MNNIIDFRKSPKKDEFVVIDPDFQIGGYRVFVIAGQKSKISVRVGCKTVVFSSAKQVKEYIHIIKTKNIPEPERETVSVIIPKGLKPKKTSPKFSEESSNFLISTSGTIFKKTTHEVVTATFTIPPKIPIKIQGNHLVFENYVIRDTDNILFILEKILNEFYGKIEQ